MKFTALLPMKAHSERIKDKNFKNFKGKPLFRWILDTLIENDRIDNIIINTDNVDKFASYEGTDHSKVVLRKRPTELQGDFVSMNKIIEYDLSCDDSDCQYLMTHSTNPLISNKTIDLAIEKYSSVINNQNDSLFTVNQYQSRFYDKSNKPINHNPEVLLRTQDLDPLYEENSCLYIFNKHSFKKTHARIGENPYLFVTEPIESVDIDDYNSWQQAEIYFDIINKNEI